MPDYPPISLRQISLDVRGDRFLAEFYTSWAVAVLYRAPSIPLVWVAARLGLRPMSVTVGGLILVLSMPLQALYLPLAWSGIAVALSAAVFQVLDCVDGTLARITGQTSRRGGDMDAMTDLIQWGMLYLAIGILADRTLPDTGHAWALLGMAAAWVRLMARMARDRTDTGTDVADAPPRPPSPAQWPVAFLGGISGLLPFLALTGEYLWISVWFLLIYAVLDLLEGGLAMLSTSD